MRRSILGVYLLQAGFSPWASSRAADLTYNPGTVPLGGTAVWDSTTLNWLNGSAPTAWANTTSTNATFTGTSATVGVTSGGLNAGNLTFSSDGWLINGGSLTLAANAASTISVGSGYTATISTGLLNGFTKAGVGTLVLANTASANTGDVTTGAGTLKMGAANQIADTATLAVGGGATFDMAGFGDTFALSANSTATGTITNSNSATASTLTFSNTTAFTYGGVFSGNLALSDTANSLGLTLAGTAASTNTGTLTLLAPVTNYFTNSGGNAVGGNLTLTTGGVTLLAANQISDTATVTVDIATTKTAAVFNLNGFNETIGTLNSVNSGTADTTNAHLTLGSGTLTIAGTATSTFAGIISGTGGIIKQGTANLTLTGANTFTGGITVKAGTLIVNNDASLGVNGTTYGPLTLDGGSLNGGNFNVALNAARTVNVGPNGTTFNVGSTSSATYTFTLPTALTNIGSSAGNISKISQGTLITQANSGTPLGTGTFNLNAGTLAFQPSGSGANVAIQGVNASTSSRLSYGVGTALALNAGANNGVTLTLGNTGVAAGVVMIRNGAGTLLLQPTTTANLGVKEKIIFNGGVTMTNGIIAPSILVQDQTSGAVLKGDFVTDAGGTTGLKAATYTNTNFGGTPVATDIEAVNTATTLGGSAQVYALKLSPTANTGAPATLAIKTGNTLQVGSGASGTQAGIILNGTTSGTGFGAAAITGGTLAFGAAEGLVYVNTGGGAISSAITGSGGLTLFGNGVLTLSAPAGTSTLTGAINLNAATTGAVTLRMGTANTLPSTSTLVLNAGTIFDLNNLSQTIATISGGGGTSLGTGSTGGTLTVGDATSFTYNGVISGTGSLVKQGSGTMTLSTNSTYTGGTFINAGTLQISTGSNRLPTTGAVAIVSGATLDLNNQSQTVGTLTGPGTVTNSGTTATPNLTVGNDNATFTQNTVVTGQLNYIKTGIGVVTLSSSNTYTGTSAVTAGTLQAGNAAALPSGSALTVGASTGSTAATFDLNGYNVTVGGLASGATTGARIVTSSAAGPVTLTVNNDATTTNASYTFAGVIQNGTGTVSLTKSGTLNLTLSGTNTFTGATTINSGTLTVNNTGSGVPGQLSGTSGITVNNGGSLLLAGSSTVTDRLNNAATVTVNGGGRFASGGLNEGAAPTAANGTGGVVGLGALTLTSTNSSLRAVVDFANTQTGSALVFSSLAASGKGAFVNVLNWTGTARTDSGAATNDRLLFAADPGYTSTDLANWQFFSDAGTSFGLGAQEIAYNGYYEIVPVPEPATWLGGGMLIGVVGLGLRRRLIRT